MEQIELRTSDDRATCHGAGRGRWEAEVEVGVTCWLAGRRRRGSPVSSPVSRPVAESSPCARDYYCRLPRKAPRHSTLSHDSAEQRHREQKQRQKWGPDKNQTERINPDKPRPLPSRGRGEDGGGIKCEQLILTPLEKDRS